MFIPNKKFAHFIVKYLLAGAFDDLTFVTGVPVIQIHGHAKPPSSTRFQQDYALRRFWRSSKHNGV